MAVKVIERLYNEVYTDGQTDWLLGNVGDWQKALVTVEVAIEFRASQQSPIQIDNVNNAFIIAGGQNWNTFGFDLGMVITLRYDYEQDTTGDGEFDTITPYEGEYTIQNLFASTMEVEETIQVQGFENIPTNFGARRISNVHFFIENDPEGCILTYAHLTNQDFESNNLSSFIDGTQAKFALPNLAASSSGNWLNMEPIGFQSGMSVRMARVRKLGGSSSIPTGVGQLAIVAKDPGNLEILDSSGSDPRYDSARAVAMNVVSPAPNVRTVTNDARIPQTDSQDGEYITSGIYDQAFLQNVSADATYQMFLDFNFRIDFVDNDVRINENSFQLIIARYGDGAAMTIQEEVILKTWNNLGQIQNQPLSFSGFFTEELTAGDSLVLTVKFYHNRPFNNDNFGVGYILSPGDLQVSEPNKPLPSGVEKRYQFEIQYMISSMFDSLLNFEDNVAPDYLVGDGSLTDNFDFKFYPEWNNPNVVIQNVLAETARLGNTGWFNENFNELNNDFQVDSIVYKDLDDNVIPSIDYLSPTKITAVVSGVQNLNANTECGFGFAWIPQNEEDYKNKEIPFYRNVYTQSGDLEDGFKLGTSYPGPYFGSGVLGGSMDSEDVRFTIVGNTIQMEITLVPNAAFANAFESKDEADRNYILYISVADGTLSRNFSDRVSLLADFNTLVKNITPAGPYDMDTVFLEHPYTELQEGVVEYSGITQDDVLARSRFTVRNDQNLSLQQITFAIELENTETGQIYQLETFNADLSQFPLDSNGFQAIDFDQERGFKLNQGNNKNFVQLKGEGSSTAELKNYIAYYGFKIRYEDWISRNNVPSDFFDALEENNGNNNDWYDYLNTPNSNWQIKYSVYLQALVDNEIVVYRNDHDFDFVDYDMNTSISTETRYIRDSDDTLLNIGADPETGLPLGVILQNELTRVEIDFTILDDGVWNANTVYAVTTIEIDRGGGIFEMRQLSSVWERESDNPLLPVTGEGNLKIEIDGTGKILTTTCLVDSELLQDAIRYRVTGRVGCFEGSDVITGAGVYEGSYEETYE